MRSSGKTSLSFFLDLSESSPTQNCASKEHANLLMVRKPGTPTKRKSGNQNFGEENKTLLGNRPASRESSGTAGIKVPKATLTEPRLPQRLQERLASFPERPSPEQILLKEKQVVMKRESLLKAKVEDAKVHKGRCEEVRERKKEYAKNMTLIGNCVPSVQREIKPVALPKRLVQRLSAIEAATSLHLSQQFKKEDGASQRRSQLIQTVHSKRAKHHQRVKELLNAKFTTGRYDMEVIPDFLPKALKDRLASIRRPTNETILRKENQAAMRRNLFLKSRTMEAKSHTFIVAKVQQTRNSFRANAVQFVSVQTTAIDSTRLPKRLESRLHQLAPKWTRESILEKEEATENRRRTILAAKASKARQHVQLVSQKRQDKHTRPRFEISKAAQNLPPHLVARLKQLRAPTNDALLAREQNVATRRKIILASRVHRANEQAQRTETVRALNASIKSNIQIDTKVRSRAPVALTLPLRLKIRLEAIQAAKPKPEDILAKEERASLNRAKKIEALVAHCVEHNIKVKGLCSAKMLQLRFSNNAASEALPEKLKDRMFSIQHRTAEAILRKNERASTRAKIMIAGKSFKARAHLNRVDQGLNLAKSLVKNGIEIVSGPPQKIPLPKRLADRIKSLQNNSKFTAERHFETQQAAGLRRALQVGKRCRFAKLHNACKVNKRLRENTRESRFLGIPEFLPEHLKLRLAEISRPKDSAILRKNERAYLKHTLLLERKRQLAKEHSLNVAAAGQFKAHLVTNNVDMSGKTTDVSSMLPVSLARRLTTTKTLLSADEQFAKEKKASDARKFNLKAIKNRSRAHSSVVVQRLQQKDTVPRYSNSPVAEFVPKALVEKLKQYRRSSTDGIRKKLDRASMRAEQLKQATAHDARLHSHHVNDVIEKNHQYKESMQMLTKNGTTPVKLPRRLSRRLSEIEAKSPAANALLAKEARAAQTKAELIRQRKAKLSGHIRRVSKICQQKATQPRFPQESIEDTTLPPRLKTRLMSLRVPTREALEAKQNRARDRRSRSLEQKVDAASKHAEYVAKVYSLKKEFEKNNLHFLGLSDDRVESPTVPVQLRKTLDAHITKFSMCLKSPDDIERKVSAVRNQREAILSERVAGCKQHSQKVREILERHRTSLMEEEKGEEVPETD